MNSYGVKMNRDYFGPIKSEKVLVQSNIVTTTNVFLRPDNTYWAGPVHEHDGVFMEGSSHSSVPHND